MNGDLDQGERLLTQAPGEPNASDEAEQIAECERYRAIILEHAARLAEACARYDIGSTMSALMLQAADEIANDGTIDPATERQIKRNPICFGER